MITTSSAGDVLFHGACTGAEDCNTAPNGKWTGKVGALIRVCVSDQCWLGLQGLLVSGIGLRWYGLWISGMI